MADKNGVWESCMWMVVLVLLPNSTDAVNTNLPFCTFYPINSINLTRFSSTDGVITVTGISDSFSVSRQRRVNCSQSWSISRILSRSRPSCRFFFCSKSDLMLNSLLWHDRHFMYLRTSHQCSLRTSSFLSYFISIISIYKPTRAHYSSRVCTVWVWVHRFQVQLQFIM